MRLISAQFLLFLAGLLFVYYIVPKKARWMVLLVGSLAFYFLTAPPHTFLYLLATMVTVYAAARYLGKAGGQLAGAGDAAAEALQRKRRLVFVLAVCVNVGMLVVLKYTGALYGNARSVASLFGLIMPAADLQWISALGISFYTLQVVGYLADVYWGTTEAQKSFGQLSLFVCYFPQMISGPISRYNQLGPQLYAGHAFSYHDFTFGLQRILWGLFKKLVIADRVAVIVGVIFAQPGVYQGLYVWVGALLCALQIYADFSGNMDVIMGVSECFGIRLPENFRQPFFSKTIQEFWQRWHITLGTWLRDYVMYPLMRSQLWVRMGKALKNRFGKRAAKQVPMILAMLVLWLVNGLWHGGSWKYMAVVLWFWLAVVLGQLLSPLFERLKKLLRVNDDCFSWRLFQCIRTIFVYAIGVVLFRAEGLSAGAYMLKSAVTVFNPGAVLAHIPFGETYNLIALLLGLTVLPVVEAFQANGYSVRGWVAKQNLPLRWAMYILLIVAIVVFGKFGSGYDPADFIYAGF